MARQPYRSTITAVRDRLTDETTRSLAEELKLPVDAGSALLSRVARGVPGVSYATEMDLRKRIGLGSQPVRPGLSFDDQDVVMLFRKERDRQGLTNTQYLAKLMGVAHSS